MRALFVRGPCCFYPCGSLSRDGFFSIIQNLVPKMGNVLWRANYKDVKINEIRIGPRLEMMLSAKYPAK